MGLEAEIYVFTEKQKPSKSCDFGKPKYSRLFVEFYKNYTLHVWMHRLYLRKGGRSRDNFDNNSVLLEKQDIELLKQEIESKQFDECVDPTFPIKSTPEKIENVLQFCSQAIEKMEKGKGKHMFYYIGSC